MLRYAVIFFIIAIIAAVFGFGGIAAGATEIAKILFFIFIVILYERPPFAKVFRVFRHQQDGLQLYIRPCCSLIRCGPR